MRRSHAPDPLSPVAVLVAALAAICVPAAAVAQESSDAAEQTPSALCVPTLAPRASGPQVADEEFQPPLPHRAYAAGEGPRVLVDEAHDNFHTVDGRYRTFARLLRADGYVVQALRSPFDAESLAAADVLVIANALRGGETDEAWALPTPSTFTAAEIAAVRDWVDGGGALLLIADHMPFPGAAADLAAAFGILFTDGFATDATCSDDQFVFSRRDGTLADHPITRGRDSSERVEFVRTFTGQAFRAVDPQRVQPLLVLAPGSVVLLPSVSWVFDDTTPRVRGDGMMQGAALTHGAGRVAMFGEAAMFTAQVSGEERVPMGMNMPSARDNPRFLLNVMHWLTGLLPAGPQ